MYFYFYHHHRLWQRLLQDIQRFSEYRNHVLSFCPYFYRTRKYHQDWLTITFHRTRTSDSYLKFPSFCAPQSSSFDFICAIACGNGTPCSGSYDQTTVTPIIWQSEVLFIKYQFLSEKGIIWLLAVLVFHHRPRLDQSFGVHLMKFEWILFPFIFDFF